MLMLSFSRDLFISRPPPFPHSLQDQEASRMENLEHRQAQAEIALGYHSEVLSHSMQNVEATLASNADLMSNFQAG